MTPVVNIARPLSREGPASKLPVWSRGTLALAILAGAAEIVILVAGLRGAAPLQLLLGVHAAIGLAMVLAIALLRRRDGANPAFLLFAACTAALGPLGVMGAAMTLALRTIFARHAVPFEEWYASLFPKFATPRTKQLYDRTVRGGAPEPRPLVASFADVMALGTVQQKQSVVVMIADNFRPAFAPALRRALNDSEPAIRVQAATAFARIENKFLQRAMALEHRRAAHPDDPEVLLALAQHHEEYADCGLLDIDRAQAERMTSLALYVQVQEARAGNARTIEAMGRLLLRMGQLEAALSCLERAATRPDVSSIALAAYFECLLRLRHFGHLRAASRAYSNRGDATLLRSTVGEALRLWSEAPPVERPAFLDKPVATSRPRHKLLSRRARMAVTRDAAVNDERAAAERPRREIGSLNVAASAQS